MEIAQFLIYIISFVLVCGLTYSSLQKVDFSKLFRASSTKEIRLLVLFISMAIGFIIASGILTFLQFFNK